MKVSVGFEIETQGCSPVQVPRKKTFSSPAHFWKVDLDPKIYLYPDEFTSSTVFATKTVPAFLQASPQHKGFKLHTVDDREFTIQTPLQGVFHNTEFVITFKEMEEVDHIVPHLYQTFHRAVLLLQTELKGFAAPLKITTPGFPYSYVVLHPTKPVALLSRFVDVAASSHFVCQATVGLPLSKARETLLDLAQEYARVTGNDNYLRSIQDTALRADELVPLQERHDTLLRNYMFLFVYAFTMRGKRKTASLFNVRHVFRDIWRYCFSKELRDQLVQEVSSKSNEPIEFREYFLDIHTKKRDKEEKLEFEDMSKVGILPFGTKDHIVYIEFRGFSPLIKKQCAVRGQQKYGKTNTLQRMLSIGR